MSTKTKRKKTVKKKTVSRNKESGFLRFTKNRNIAIFVVLFAVVAGFLIWRSYAASSVVFTYEDLRKQKSTNATVVPDTKLDSESGSKSTTTVVAVTNDATSTNAKAVIGDKTVFLDAGTYRACFKGRAPTADITGSFEIVKFNGGVLSISLGQTNYTATESTEYADVACVNFTTTTSDVAIVGTISNKTESGALYIANVSVERLPDVPSDALKPQLAGLADRHGYPISGYTSVVNSFVYELRWKDVESTRGTFDLSKINNAINYAKNNGMKIKLRVFAGIHSPSWAKNLDGAPPTLCDDNTNPSNPNCQTIPRFWTSNFKTAYQELVDKLANSYDDTPEIAETVMLQCSTFYAEPFQRQVSYKPNLAALEGAGWTVAKDKQCFRDMIDAHKVFKQTRSSLAVNPYQYLYDDGSGVKSKLDLAFSYEMIDYCRVSLGKACVLGNNSIRDYVQSNNYENLYAYIKSKGAPIYFQTANSSRVGDLGIAIDRAVSYGSGMVELPGGYENLMTPAAMIPYDNTVTAQADK